MGIHNIQKTKEITDWFPGPERPTGSQGLEHFVNVTWPSLRRDGSRQNAQAGNTAGADMLADCLCSLCFPWFLGAWVLCSVQMETSPSGRLVTSYVLRARALLGRCGLRPRPLLPPCSILNTVNILVTLTTTCSLVKISEGVVIWDQN